MKESHFKQLVKEVIKLVKENNPEAWRSHEHPSGEPPEPQDAEESPDVNPEQEALKPKMTAAALEMAKADRLMKMHQVGTAQHAQAGHTWMAAYKKLTYLMDDFDHWNDEEKSYEPEGQPADADTMKKSTIKETNDNRRKRISSVDYDTGVKLLFVWANGNEVSYQEFEDLMADFVAKVVKDIPKAAAKSPLPIKQ